MGGIRGKRDMRNGDLRPGWAGVDTMVWISCKDLAGVK